MHHKERIGVSKLSKYMYLKVIVLKMITRINWLQPKVLNTMCKNIVMYTGRRIYMYHISMVSQYNIYKYLLRRSRKQAFSYWPAYSCRQAIITKTLSYNTTLSLSVVSRNHFRLSPIRKGLFPPWRLHCGPASACFRLCILDLKTLYFCLN